MRWTPNRMAFVLNLYGPFRGAGIRINFIRDDWKEIHVSMKMRWYNRTLVGTHFGGSLYAMVDPQLMLMLMQVLGKNYYVWDKSAEIDFIKPGKGTVSARFLLTDTEIEDIKNRTSNGEKHFPRFKVKIVDDCDEVVANVNKMLYVRRKKLSAR